MKLIFWNIKGCSNPRKGKTLNRKIKQENPNIMFLQETKCSFEGLEKIRDKIWKGSHLMAMDAVGQAGGMQFPGNQGWWNYPTGELTSFLPWHTFIS